MDCRIRERIRSSISIQTAPENSQVCTDPHSHHADPGVQYVRDSIKLEAVDSHGENIISL